MRAQRDAKEQKAKGESSYCVWETKVWNFPEHHAANS
jgi:hypothetical protein